MRIAFYFSLALSFALPAHADIWFEDTVIFSTTKNKTPSTKKTFLQSKNIRVEMKGNQQTPDTFIIGNEKGMFSCLPQRKTCSKNPYMNGASTLFGSGALASGTVSLSLKPTGARHTIKGLRCNEYQVERVVESKEEQLPTSVRVHSKETNCYSAQFRDLMPKELIADFRKGITESKTSPQVKKKMLDELALGVAIKYRIQSKTLNSATPEPVISLEGQLKDYKSTPLSASLFEIPAGFQVMDFSAVRSNAGLPFPKQGAGNAVPPLPKEQLEQLKKLKESGQLPAEAQQYLDTLLNQN